VCAGGVNAQLFSVVHGLFTDWPIESNNSQPTTINNPSTLVASRERENG